jgi:hypothetical protein
MVQGTENVPLPNIEKISKLGVVNIVKKGRVGDHCINGPRWNVGRSRVTARKIDGLSI